MLAAHGDRLHEVDSGELMVQVLLRISTDGTLFDALRAATWTGGGAEDLVAFDDGAEAEPKWDEAEPKWDEALRAVPDPRLRDHLRMLSLTAQSARCDGAYYLGPGQCPVDLSPLVVQPGHEAIAGWEFGEGQAASVVFGIR